MKILVSGASGLIGSALVSKLKSEGHEVWSLVRSQAVGAHEIAWHPAEGTIDSAGLEGFDAVVHLAGENIAGGRWTEAKKKRIRDSRVEGTRLLATALAKSQSPPQTLVCASAIGYYGDRGDEELTEKSSPGKGFLAAVCEEWENAADPARDKGIRVVHVRIGVVLSRHGGALEKMLTPFKMCVGGIVGDGRQYWSWVARDDVAGIIQHALTHDQLHGPVNAVSPQPVTNYEFTKTLGSVLGRPTIFPMPAFAAKLALGEMAEELLLSSTRVLPTRLQDTDYKFQHAELREALEWALRMG